MYYVDYRLSKVLSQNKLELARQVDNKNASRRNERHAARQVVKSEKFDDRARKVA